MKQESSLSRLSFGLFELNLQVGELRKQGLKIKLGRNAFTVLALLLEHPGQLRTREEIRQQLWGTDTFVNFDQSVNKAIYELREALGDSASNPYYIETVAARGYRFIYFAPESSQATRKQIRNLHSIAVLPFATDPADREIELFSKSIVRRLIDTISQTPGLRVLAYSTVQHYWEQDLNPQTDGQNLPVRIVALGEMTRSDDELLLHVELVDVGDGTQLWGAQFKQPYTDVLARPEKLATRISDQIRPILARTMRRRKRKGSKRVA